MGTAGKTLMMEGPRFPLRRRFQKRIVSDAGENCDKERESEGMELGANAFLTLIKERQQAIGSAMEGVQAALTKRNIRRNEKKEKGLAKKRACPPFSSPRKMFGSVTQNMASSRSISKTVNEKGNKAGREGHRGRSRSFCDSRKGRAIRKPLG